MTDMIPQVRHWPETLNWKQACEVLGCKKTFFYVLVQTGQLPGIRLGLRRGVRVRLSDCLEYLEKRRLM